MTQNRVIAQNQGKTKRTEKILRLRAVVRALAPAIALAAALVLPRATEIASAHTDTCASGQSAIVGTTICVQNSKLEFWDWCVGHDDATRIPHNDHCRIFTSDDSICPPFMRYSKGTTGGRAFVACEYNGATQCAGGRTYSAEQHACECPAGQARVTRGNATECFSDAIAAQAAACEAEGWTTSLGADGGAQRGLYCDIPVAQYDSAGQLVTDGRCAIVSATDESGLTCETVFGAPLSFPTKADHSGVTPVRNPATDDPPPSAEVFQSHCAAGGAGGFPTTTNSGDTTFCGCNAAARFEGDFPNCQCAEGSALSPSGSACINEAEARAAANCRNAYDETTGHCAINLRTGAGARSSGCFIGGTGTPQCADVFGAELIMPEADTTDGTHGSIEYVYNCGNGAIPRTTSAPNALGRYPQFCYCDGSAGFSGNYDREGCGCVPGRVLSDDGSACVPCPSGQAEDGGVCVETCPTAGEVIVDGICDVACPSGQRRIHSSDIPGISGCVPLAAARALVDCENAGWPARDVASTNTLPRAGQLRCGIRSDLHGDGLNPGACLLYNNGATITDTQRPCLKIYGDPPVYPRAEEHPDIRSPAPGTTPGSFVSHCAEDKDGNAIAGGWPAAANQNGVTACGCDAENGYGGPWPNCAECAYNEVVDGNYETCGTCPTGMLAEDLQCVDECSTGKLIQEGGCVDDCSLGYSEFEGTCYSGCPPGTAENESGGCDSCAADGKVEDEGVCVDACPRDKASEDGACVLCAADLFVSAGACVESCPSGQHGVEGVCGACPAGQGTPRGRNECVDNADVEWLDFCYGNGGSIWREDYCRFNGVRSSCAPFIHSTFASHGANYCENDGGTACVNGKTYSSIENMCACPSNLPLDNEGTCVATCPDGKRALRGECVVGSVCNAGEFATNEGDMCVPYNRLEFGNWCEALDESTFQYSAGITFDWECELTRVSAEATDAKRTALCSPYRVDSSTANANLNGNAALRFWCHPDDGVTACPAAEGYLPTSLSCGACPGGTGAEEGLCVSQCAAGTYRETRILVNAGAQAAIDAIDNRRSSGSAAVQPVFDALIEAVQQWALRQGDDSNILAPLEGVEHNTDSVVQSIMVGAVANNRDAFPNNSECSAEAGRAYAECVIGRLPRNAEGGAATSGGVCVSQCSSANPLADDGVCVAECAGDNSLREGGFCVSECTGEKVESGGVCVDACPADSPWNENGVCVAECSEENLEQVDKCVPLCESGYFLNLGVCERECPDGQTAIPGRDTCVADSELEFWGWCLERGRPNAGGFQTPSQCWLPAATPCAPYKQGSAGTQGGVSFHVCENSPPNPGDPAPTFCGDGLTYSADVHSCVCEDEGRANLSGNCVAACPIPLLNERGICVSECATGGIADRENYACHHCPSELPFLSGGACVFECPAGAAAAADGVCESCAAQGKLLESRACVESCSADLYESAGHCVELCPFGTSIDDGVCVEGCGEGRVSDGGVCADECSGAQVVNEGVCVDQCPADKGLDLDDYICYSDCPNNGVKNQGFCASSCGSGRVAVDSFCRSPDDLTDLLRAEVRKPAPDAGEVRRLAFYGANVDASISAVPLLITAAALGHSVVVSVLITLGADPAAKWDDLTVPFLLADTSAGLAADKRPDVLRHFGEAVKVRGTLFDWNEPLRRANELHISQWMDIGMGQTGFAPAFLEMTDYMLAQGMSCAHLSTSGTRYSDYCVGTLGRALEELVNQGRSATLVLAADVRAVAQAMVDAGISPDVAGSPMGGHLIPLAAFWGQQYALSVLLTFGMDPHGGDTGGRTALNYAAQNSNSDAVMLDVLRAFISGLDASGKLTGADAYDGWNATTHGSGTRTPLEIFQNIYGTATDSADLDERHALFYDYGSRCASPGAKKYCQVPTREITLTARTAGRVLTVSRTPLGFRSLSPGVSSSLSANGWTVAVFSDVSPQEFVVSRTRNQSPGGTDAAAIFTLTMTNAASSDADSRFVMLSLAAAYDVNYDALVSSVLEGDVDGTRSALNSLGTDALDASTNGVPLLITAAVLGHAEVVSVLLTAGYDADTRSPFGGFELNIPLLMATYDGTRQPGGGELSRDKRLEVLRHFGDALEVRGVSSFDWNRADKNGNDFPKLLGFSEGQSHGTEAERLAMADYALSRGMNCESKTLADRYGKYCIGGLGGDLYNAIAAANVNSATVRAAALAMADAGISITIAGGVYATSITANVLGIAMHRLRQNDVGVLISLGADPNSRAGGYAAPHIAARAAQSDPIDALGMLQSGFIEGMLAAGTFSQFTAWNESVGGKTPLDWLQDAVTSQSNSTFKNGLHVQLYEQESRCATASGQYCELPQATNIRAEPAMGTGAVLTVLSRRFSGFRSPPVASDVLTSLTANGWGVSQQASPRHDNPDMLLTRERPGLETDAAAIFTVTVTSAAGTGSQAIYVSATTALESDAVSLAAAVKAGDVAATRFWLATLGAKALTAQTQDDPPIPLLIAAAVRGHGEVASVLVTFGVDVNARHPDSSPPHDGNNVPFLMADFGNDSALGLTRTQRREMIEHFGNAIAVRGTTFAWNEADSSGGSLPDALAASDALTSDSAERAVLLETADYLLARGMSCATLSAVAERYADFCAGGKGLALVSLITRDAGDSPSDAAVRAAARAMIDAGIPLEAAGDKARGHLVPVAAFKRHAGALSVLLTFGMNPLGRKATDAAPHLVATGSDDYPAEMLSVLRAFIGGLSVAGKLESFGVNGWNALSGSDSPLDLLQRVASQSESGLADKREIHSLLYEYGARCAANNSGGYCDIPADNFPLPPVAAAGAFFTLTARALSDFQSPPVAAGVSATLAENGWGISRNTIAEPNELELNRIRLASSTDLAAVFTVTLTSAAGTASREMRVWATVAQGEVPQAYYDLVTAVYEGNAAETRRILREDSDSALTDASDEDGVPLLIVAATLAHLDVARALADFEFNLQARSGGKTATDLMRDLFDAATSARQNAYYQIADFLLARGVSCSGGIDSRYDPPCVGSAGAALASLIAMTTPVSDDDVRAAARAVVDAGISLDFVGADGAGELVAVGAANGHSSAMSILLTFGMNPGGMGGGSGRTSWTALHHIAQGADNNAAESLTLLRSFIGGLRGSGRLRSFSGWNAESDSVGRPLDVFHEAAILNEDSLDEKEAMYELFYLRGAECADPGDKRYCGLPREEHSFLNVGATGPVVTLVGTGAGSEMFVLPGHSRTVELYNAGWILRLNANAVPPEVVLLRDAVGTFNEAAVQITLSLLSGGRTVREYRITARAEFFFDCAAINKKEPPGGFGGCGSCLDDSTEIAGDCVRRNGDFRRSPHRTVCEDYLGGRVVQNVVCRGVDEDGTFCIMGSRDVFPCRGFFRHILRCNLIYNRPGLNPFACGASCGDPTVDQVARGASCE